MATPTRSAAEPKPSPRARPAVTSKPTVQARPASAAKRTVQGRPAAPSKPLAPADAVEQAVADNSTSVTLPLVGEVDLPPVDHLVYYAAVAAFAAVELIDWPIAVLVAAGKMLADNRTHRTLRSVGSAMEDAG